MLRTVPGTGRKVYVKLNKQIMECISTIWNYHSISCYFFLWEELIK